MSQPVAFAPAHYLAQADESSLKSLLNAAGWTPSRMVRNVYSCHQYISLAADRGGFRVCGKIFARRARTDWPASSVIVRGFCSLLRVRSVERWRVVVGSLLLPYRFNTRIDQPGMAHARIPC
jgi:hypothetical protein